MSTKRRKLRHLVEVEAKLVMDYTTHHRFMEFLASCSGAIQIVNLTTIGKAEDLPKTD